ncbi:unnamed protein product [Moneuplotes crassus]|uniref:Uncharacterized protein n=1 Tax=Euplotes crassus TaxID=5936 RepID=A0AAD1XDI6_EUPCR|nr:unnamed protein product [Moneuplotes crassus]
MKKHQISSNSVDRDNIRKMMKYNLDDLFQDPHIFEWPPLVYEELQNDGWNYLTEAVVGSRYEAIGPFFKNRKIKFQKQLSLLKNQRREGLLLNQYHSKKRVVFEEDVKKAIETPLKSSGRRNKSRRFNPASLETAKVRRERFSITALRKEFVKKAEINKKYHSSKNKGFASPKKARSTERKGISQRISTHEYYPSVDRESSVQNNKKATQLKSYSFSEKKKLNNDIIDYNFSKMCFICESFTIINSQSDEISFEELFRFLSRSEIPEVFKKIHKTPKFKFLTNSGIKAHKKAFMKSLKKITSEKSRSFINFGTLQRSEKLGKPKPDSMTVYGCYSKQSKEGTYTRNSPMLVKEPSGTTLADTVSPLTAHKRFTRNNIRFKKMIK